MRRRPSPGFCSVAGAITGAFSPAFGRAYAEYYRRQDEQRAAAGAAGIHAASLAPKAPNPAPAAGAPVPIQLQLFQNPP